MEQFATVAAWYYLDSNIQRHIFLITFLLHSIVYLYLYLYGACLIALQNNFSLYSFTLKTSLIIPDQAWYDFLRFFPIIRFSSVRALDYAGFLPVFNHTLKCLYIDWLIDWLTEACFHHLMYCRIQCQCSSSADVDFLPENEQNIYKTVTVFGAVICDNNKYLDTKHSNLQKSKYWHDCFHALLDNRHTDTPCKTYHQWKLNDTNWTKHIRTWPTPITHKPDL